MATKEEQPQVLENKEEPKEDGELPLVVVLRSKNFNLPLEDRLQSHFHLLDPNYSPDDSTKSFLSRHAHWARALLCVGLTLSLLTPLVPTLAWNSWLGPALVLNTLTFMNVAAMESWSSVLVLPYLRT